MESRTSGGSSGNLSIDGQPTSSESASEDVSGIEDQWSSVINVHDGNLHQIEVALEVNSRMATTPHPSDPTKRVRAHPVYLVAVDYSSLDEEGRPMPGKPLELDLATIRDIFSTRYPDWVAPGDPPEDGSHVHIRDSHFIAEKDSMGNPTGRVILGTPEDAE